MTAIALVHVNQIAGTTMYTQTHIAYIHESAITFLIPSLALPTSVSTFPSLALLQVRWLPRRSGKGHEACRKNSSCPPPPLSSPSYSALPFRSKAKNPTYIPPPPPPIHTEKKHNTIDTATTTEKQTTQGCTRGHATMEGNRVDSQIS